MLTLTGQARERLAAWEKWARAQPDRDEAFWEENLRVLMYLAKVFKALPWFEGAAIDAYFRAEVRK